MIISVFSIINLIFVIINNYAETNRMPNSTGKPGLKAALGIALAVADHPGAIRQVV